MVAGEAVLVYDDEIETANIFLADDPILKSLIQYRSVIWIDLWSKKCIVKS